MIFDDRESAGRHLAQRLWRYAGTDCVVLALPRGGVEVGFTLAQQLGCPLDVIVSKRICAPFDPEVAIGAVSEEGVLVSRGAPFAYLRTEARRLRGVIHDLRMRYTQGVPPAIMGKTAIIVDDGAATGFTALAAARYARRLSPGKIVIALPAAPLAAISDLGVEADEIVCLSSPEHFTAVGEHYLSFPQVGDERVVELLQRASEECTRGVGKKQRLRAAA